MFSFFYVVIISYFPFLWRFLRIGLFLAFLILFFNNNFYFTIIFIFLLLLSVFFYALFFNLEFSFFNKFIVSNVKIGIAWFIFREVMLFFGFFWTLFDRSLNPNIELGNLWPSFYINPLNPFLVPLLNTLVLLSSGFFVTLAHYYIVLNHKKSVLYIGLTIVLGVYFSILQLIEYKNLNFTIIDSIFGSSFFLFTGFHGIHVLCGSILLFIIIIRIIKLQINKLSHVGIEISIWYWHFVDVVWLFLYRFIYWWRFN